MSDTRPLDPNVLQRQASDPDSSVWVGASAGSGKTKVLTDRVLRLMLTGSPPSRILCLTFTKAAAAEMALRVNRTLGKWATASDAELDQALFDLNAARPGNALRIRARQLFARVVDCPGGLKIQTIHAFCQSLLRRFPLEAGAPPQFEAMDDVAARALVGESLREALLAARLAPDSELGSAVLALSGVLGEDEFAQLTGHLVAERGRLAAIFDRHGGVDNTLAETRRVLDISETETVDGLLGAACDDARFDPAALRAALPALLNGAKTDIDRAGLMAPWLAADHAGRVAGFADYRLAFFTKTGDPRAKLTTRATQAYADVLAAEQERLVRLDGRLRAAQTAAYTAALLRLADGLLTRYRQKKEQRACLDFDDLILGAIHLLSGRVPWVLYKLDGGLDHILIDEAQDTNPDQWRVVGALADEFFAGLGTRDADAANRTMFAVGDEKQSIFSFQRADPAEFARMRRHFAERAQAADQPWRPVALDISFRSVAAVLECADGVFANSAAKDGVVSQPDQIIRHYPFRRGQGGLVELWPPVVPEETEAPAPWTPPVAGGDRRQAPSARLAGTIAATIRGWLDRGERLVARDRPIRPGDILVLVRTRSRFVNELVRALKDLNVPVAGADRLVLTDSLAVLDLAATANFLLLPDDDLTLATVLKGPFIGLTDDELFELAHGRRGRLWAALLSRAAHDPVYAPAAGWLKGLLDQVDFVRPYELFGEILTRPCPADTRSGRRAMLGRLGPDALEAVDEFLAMALSFERSEAPSLQRFLGWFAASQAQVKREHEQSADQVRIMTVHGSKGLQAPVVFLPDTMGAPTRSVPVLWPDARLSAPLYAPRRGLEADAAASARADADVRRDQEYRRLLYVALTRAEDRLYVCGWQGGRKPAEGCWHNLVAAALNRLGEPADIAFADGSVGEGRRLTTPQTVPVTQEQAKTKDESAAAARPDWLHRPAPLEAATARPLTPSKPDAEEPGLTSPLDETADSRSPLAGRRDDGARFRRGLVIHRLLQTLPELPPDERAAAGARYLAACHGDVPAARRADWLDETLKVLETPEAAILFGPDSRAEAPLVGQVGDRVLSGQIDRLALTTDTVWIVDYKTNRPPPADPADVAPVYLRQMAAYRAALAVIYPGRAVRCLLLWTDGPRLMDLPAALLDKAAASL